MTTALMKRPRPYRLVTSFTDVERHELSELYGLHPGGFFALLPVTQTEFYRLTRDQRPPAARERRRKWRKGSKLITFEKLRQMAPTEIIWDDLAHRAQNVGFLWGWPYLTLGNCLAKGRFYTAEKNQ